MDITDTDMDIMDMDITIVITLLDPTETRLPLALQTMVETVVGMAAVINCQP